MKPKEIFKIMPTNEEKSDWIVIVGKHLATGQHFKTFKEAKNYMEAPNWETLVAVVAEMIDINEETKKIKENGNN